MQKIKSFALLLVIAAALAAGNILHKLRGRTA
jgi:hypothetical protein